MKAVKYIFAVVLAIGSLSLVGCTSDNMANNAGGALDGYDNGYYSDYYNYGDGSGYGYGTGTGYGTMYNNGWAGTGNNWNNGTGYGTSYNGNGSNWSVPYSGTNTVE